MTDAWKGTCECCGEPDTELRSCNAMPEGFDGVCCLRCAQFYEDQAESDAHIEHGRRLDRLDDTLSDALRHGDFND